MTLTLINSARPIEILLVEDSPSDAGLTERSLRRAGITNTLHVVEDGESALKRLRNSVASEAEECPDLILLDLNLPRMDGHELLAELRADEDLNEIPVVVLTTSPQSQDRNAAEAQQAAGVLRKPLDPVELISVIQSLDRFQITITKRDDWQ